jgi:hypothetical protein
MTKFCSSRSLCGRQSAEIPRTKKPKIAILGSYLLAYMPGSFFNVFAMFTLLRHLPWRTVQPCLVSSCRRNIAFSAARRAEVGNLEGEKDGDTEEFEEERFAANSAEMLETFIQTVGAKFKTPTRPNNWLGDDRVGCIPSSLLAGPLIRL